MKVLHNGKAIIVGLEDINLDDFPNLKVIGCNMTGTERLPLVECERRGIKVISLASPRDKETEEFLSGISSTSEHSAGLILALMRNYKSALCQSNLNRETYRGHTLRGKTLGIVGMGRIGMQLAGFGRAFGMSIFWYDLPKLNEINSCIADGENIWVLDQPTSISDLLSRSDIISIHIPLTNNEGFFTKEMFQQMKPTAYFINTSRSGVVDKGALLWALENATIAGAAVDFIDDPELVAYAETHDNLVLTNHLGGCTFEDMRRTEEFIVRRVEEFLHNDAMD